MAFSFYTPFTIATGQVPSSQSNFAAVIKPANATRFKTVGNGGHVQNSSGFDIRPYSDASLTTALTYELVSYDGTNGTFEMWVKITAVDGQIVYMAYGDSGISTDGSSGANTFSNSFLTAFHFGDGTTLSTTNSVDGTSASTNNAVTAATGKIGGAGSWDGSTSYLEYSDVWDVTGNCTFSCWINPTDISTVNKRVVDKRGGSGQGFVFGICDNVVGVDFQNVWWTSVDTTADGNQNSLTATSTWYHIVMMYDGSNANFFVNGATSGAPAFTTNPSNSTLNFTIGARASTFANNFPGLIDELHTANVARTANWITTEYNNGNAPNTFWTIGAEVSADVLLAQSVF